MQTGAIKRLVVKDEYKKENIYTVPIYLENLCKSVFFFLLKISKMVRSVEETSQLILYSNYSRHQKLNYQT